jgi:DNA polymerase-2
VNSVTEKSGRFRGFVVHGYVDPRRDRLNILGRLEDGSSFAAVETRWRPPLHVYEPDLERCRNLLASFKYGIVSGALESFEGKEKLARLEFPRYGLRALAAKTLESAGIPLPDGDAKPVDAFFCERQIRGYVEIEGPFRQGKIVDLVFSDPLMRGSETPVTVPLRILSIDIETDVKTGTIRAVGTALCHAGGRALDCVNSTVRVLLPDASAGPGGKDIIEGIIFHHDEKDLLKAFIADVRAADPDVLTGWNFLDFDYPRLAGRCDFHRIPFMLGRSPERAKFFPGSGGEAESGGEKNPNDSPWFDRRRSAAALVPGRQVVDALRIMRSGPRRLPSYTLEAAALSALGEGKLVASSGERKIDELEKLYREDPARFGEYCRRDAELVPRILEKTGLFRLTLERSSLTGVSLDKAWTSVVSFERVYGLELRRRGIAQPPDYPGRQVSGAAGGTVLDPLTGFFPNVAVFDFRSLYPTIIRTFNIDPLAHARASGNDIIRAPNGAAFSRNPGILPELIASYFAARRKALDSGDEEASHVYKILMNSFYGVLGTSSCRYGLTELAGAITSFARKWLLFSRDWFCGKGFRVLYGDTDSLFVETGLGDSAAYGDFKEWALGLTDEINTGLSEKIREDYGLESFLELRFDKAYRRFMIPPLRNYYGKDGGKNENRGRAKGYGGWLLDAGGSATVEVKGMEAVRSDSTPLARRIQVELLALVFKGGGREDFKKYVFDILTLLRKGVLDEELVYRKRLSRPPESYTASTPPQVKAAKALGWQNRKGTVEYVWTVAGPEPVSLRKSPVDYDHYADSQVLPVAGSIAAAAGWNTEIFPRGKHDRLRDGQMELDLL